MNTIDFVSHRGLMQEYPENSLLAFTKSLEAGGLLLECDVHLSQDLIPVVLHDAELLRTSGLSGTVFEMDACELQQVSIGYPAKFSEQFIDQTIPLLSELVALVKRCPASKLFVELKRTSLNHYGRELMLKKVLAVLAPIHSQVIIISFNYAVLELAKDIGVERIGWIVERCDAKSEAMAERLAVDYLFVNCKVLSAQRVPAWSGPWRWVVYDVVDPVIAREFISQGAMVESENVKSLIAHCKGEPG